MHKKLFVLFIVLILSISLVTLFEYDKKVIELEKETIQSDEFSTEENNNEQIEWEENCNEQDDILGTLEIEKIGLNGSIKEGSSTEVLKEYIGHIEETAKYDGNVGLAAHNRGNQYSYFARINELEFGDEIIYKSKYGERRYVVSNKKAILETDWSMLENTKENKLTLITCIRNKVNQRLCVQAVQKAL